MKRPANNTHVLFYLVAVLIIAGSVAILYRVLTRFEQDVEYNLDRIRRVFSDESVLKPPYDHQIRFNTVEDLADKFEKSRYIDSLTVTKYFEQEERVVYPFFIPAFLENDGVPREPVPDQVRAHLVKASETKGVRQLKLVSRKMHLGNLYVNLNDTDLRNVRYAIMTLSGFLCIAVGLLVGQFRRQQQVISRTTVELEEKRRELVRLERLALAGQLSANIFHDIKKPILNIKNELTEIREAGTASAGEPLELQKSEGRIRDQVDLFFSILRESSLERFVRAEGDREYSDINDLLDRSLALVRYERGDTAVDKHYASAIPPVLAEPVRIIQVFSNVILNAYQAMEGKGTLTISTIARDGYIQITISDTGPGIPPEAMDRIFAPFFTTKARDSGTGLGLYITQDILQEMGGRITATSFPHGTTFVIEIPQEEVQSPTSVAPEAPITA